MGAVRDVQMKKRRRKKLALPKALELPDTRQEHSQGSILKIL
jgi:hypothetical protein